MECTVLLCLCPVKVSEALHEDVYLMLSSGSSHIARSMRSYACATRRICLRKYHWPSSQWYAYRFLGSPGKLTATFVQHNSRTYLRSEIEEVVDKWDELSQLEDEEALATFAGKCLLRANRASTVSQWSVLDMSALSLSPPPARRSLRGMAHRAGSSPR